MPTARQAVAFDFDYTLADSSPGVIDCVRHSFGRMRLRQPEADAIRATIGLSLPDTLVALCGEAQRPRAEEFRHLFKARADETMARNTTFYESVDGVMRQLRSRELKVAIASSKFRYRIEGLLVRDGLDAFVDTVVGAEDVAVHKPDPAGLQLALHRIGVAPAAAIYVGDSAVDAEAAERAGVDFVAVLSGTTPAAAFADYPSAAVLPSVSQLPSLLASGGRSPRVD